MRARAGGLTLRHLVAALAGPDAPAATAVPDVELRSAVIDSRLAGPGSLFIALRGEHSHGQDFVADAFAQGAVAAITEKAPPGAMCECLYLTGQAESDAWRQEGLPLCLVVPDSLKALQQAAAYWRRQHDPRVVGITGSVGKTTSKEVIAAVLAQEYHILKSEGNYNNEIGLPLTLLHLTARHQCVVLEMGMYDIGEIAQLAEIALPQVGVVTDVGPVHLERLGTIERIAQAKAELPQALPEAGQGGVAVLNMDDHRVQGMAGQTRARVFTYGLSPEADLRASHIESDGLEGIRFRFHYRGETIHARVPLLGRHSVHTALRGAAVGLVEDMAWAEIMTGLRDQSAQLRLVAVPGPNDSTLLDDTYNASPASCIAALNLLDELFPPGNGGRKIAVLGDMYELGSYEEEGHRVVGRRAREVADLLVTVGELGHMIGEEALSAGMRVDGVYMLDTKAQAIEVLQDLVKTGDLVLIKGSRGLEMEEIVAALQEEVA
ncbi:MAG: UDP-N-acetylmuramoyl-tripeptide--D-alanyl-D-alanine ligase [Anaerolineae bacterium]|nr:UDP-N-acetylmuramoyl-tripeptide--D-alanyl-D-alanine ligase [Anaerolineae bacterium]